MKLNRQLVAFYCQGLGTSERRDLLSMARANTDDASKPSKARDFIRQLKEEVEPANQRLNPKQSFGLAIWVAAILALLVVGRASERST